MLRKDSKSRESLRLELTNDNLYTMLRMQRLWLIPLSHKSFLRGAMNMSDVAAMLILAVAVNSPARQCPGSLVWVTIQSSPGALWGGALHRMGPKGIDSQYVAHVAPVRFEAS